MGQYTTEMEIRAQHDALERTFAYFEDNKADMKAKLQSMDIKKVVFIGCGSSYSLCKSAEVSFRMRSEIPVSSMAAGDLYINFEHYKEELKGALIVIDSRSGETSEAVRAVEKAKKECGVYAAALLGACDTTLAKICDINIELPWIFDKSVCQTRTVTNLYAANLLFISLVTGNDKLYAQVKEGIQFAKANMDVLDRLSQRVVNEIAFENIVVLGDSEVCGLAEEGALAFNEICQLPSSYYHVLDVRHGPMVLIREKTLVMIVASCQETALQQALVKDIQKKGAKVVSCGAGVGADMEFLMDNKDAFAAAGLSFIVIPQFVSYYKALKNGINPDLPDGLNAWIQL